MGWVKRVSIQAGEDCCLPPGLVGWGPGFKVVTLSCPRSRSRLATVCAFLSVAQSTPSTGVGRMRCWAPGPELS